MDEPRETRRLAEALIEASPAAEEVSLRRALAALRHQRRRRRWRRATAGTGVAAMLLVLFVWAGRTTLQDSTESPQRPAVAADSAIVPQPVRVRSRPADWLVVRSQLPAGDGLERVSSRSATRMIVNSTSSRRLEFLTDEQLLAAFAGHPLMVTRSAEGERRLWILNEDASWIQPADDSS